MEEFNKEEFLAELQKSCKEIAERSGQLGIFIGIDAGLQMVEKLLDREGIPDPMPKELLRTFIKEFRKENENNKQKWILSSAQ